MVISKVGPTVKMSLVTSLLRMFWTSLSIFYPFVACCTVNIRANQPDDKFINIVPASLIFSESRL